MTVAMLLAALGSPAPATDNVAAGGHYLFVDQHGYLSMWVESNGEQGLQTEPVLVMGRVTVWPDTRLHL
jgi:hypothetical protein